MVRVPKQGIQEAAMLDNVLGPNISSLAADAAVELDLLIQGENTELESVKLLGEQLKSTLAEIDVPDPVSQSPLLDTATETILGQAFTMAGNVDPKTILHELLQRTREVANGLSAPESVSKPSELEWSRAFCLALSQSASAYRQLMFNARNPHPFRR